MVGANPIATWRHAVVTKLEAGPERGRTRQRPVWVGARLLDRAATGLPRKLRYPLIEAAQALRTPGDPFARAALALSPEVTGLLAEYPLREFGHPR